MLVNYSQFYRHDNVDTYDHTEHGLWFQEMSAKVFKCKECQCPQFTYIHGWMDGWIHLSVAE